MEHFIKIYLNQFSYCEGLLLQVDGVYYCQIVIHRYITEIKILLSIKLLNYNIRHSNIFYNNKTIKHHKYYN